jgi:hypothetical protein
MLKDLFGLSTLSDILERMDQALAEKPKEKQRHLDSP